MRLFYLMFVIIALSACQNKVDISDIAMQTLDGGTYKMGQVGDKKAIVVYFLSPECPLSQNYTLAINELQADYGEKEVQFMGIFPGEWYSAEEIIAFKEKYQLQIPLYIDNKKELTIALGATITPEAFLLDSKGNIRYQGKIDNWVNELGKKKLEVSEKYLENAITAYLEETPIEPEKTKAIGCLIE